MITRTTYLPARRKRAKMGVQKPPQRIYPRHRNFVRSHNCAVPGCPLPATFAHFHSVGSGGHDKDGVPLCHNHHMEQHACGIWTFQDRHGVDLEALAAELARKTPDSKMRLALLEASLDTPSDVAASEQRQRYGLRRVAPDGGETGALYSANPLGLIPIINPSQRKALPHADPDAGRGAADLRVAHPLIPIRGRPGHASPVLRDTAARNPQGLHRAGASGNGADRQPAEVARPTRPIAGILARPDLATDEGRLQPRLIDELRAILFCPTKRARAGETAKLHALLLWRGLAEPDIGDFIRITKAGRDALSALFAFHCQLTVNGG